MGFGILKTVTEREVSIQTDATPDNSDKIFTVPDGEIWEVWSVYATLVTTATAGNRGMVVEWQDNSGNVLGSAQAGATQAASLTRKYHFASGLTDLTGFRNTDHLTTPLPRRLFLPAGYKIRVYERAAIDAAADDLTVRMIVASQKQ